MAGIGFSGTDWLGLGNIFEGLTEGTEMCGAKPLTGDKTAYEKCIRDSITLQAQQVQAQTSAIILAEKRKKMVIIAVVSLVSLSILVVAIVLIRRKRRN